MHISFYLHFVYVIFSFEVYRKTDQATVATNLKLYKCTAHWLHLNAENLIVVDERDLLVCSDYRIETALQIQAVLSDVGNLLLQIFVDDLVSLGPHALFDFLRFFVAYNDARIFFFANV